MSSIKHNMLCCVCKYPYSQGVNTERHENIGIFLWKSRFGRVKGGDYEMVNRPEFEGMLGGRKAQGAGGVESVWIGWKSRKRGALLQVETAIMEAADDML
jgi:hypothetical protein